MSKRVKFNDNVGEIKNYEYKLDYENERDGDVRKYGYIEDDIKFTAFNMKNERKYGSVQTDGFVFNQKERNTDDPFLEADNWLDSIVNDTEFVDNGEEEQDDINEQQQEPLEAPIDRREEAVLYGQISGFLLDNETVAKAIKRLGASSKQPQKRVYKKRRLSHPDESTPASTVATEPAELPANMNQMLQLTGLATRIVNEFDGYEIYSLTRPALQLKIEKIDKLLQK